MTHRKHLSPGDHFFALGVYSFLTIIFLYSYLLNPHGFNGSGDDAVFANSFWWFKHCLTEFKTPFFSDYLFHPDGMSLVFHTTTYSNFILTLPINVLWGVNAAVNASYLLGFILCGYFTYLLVYDLTSSKSAAIVAGIIFSFSPFHFSHGRGHLQMATLQWLPLYFMMLRRALESRKVVHALYAGIALGLIILTDQLQTICVVLASGIILTTAFIAAAKRAAALQKSGRQLGVIAAAASLVSCFYLYPALREILSNRSATKVGVLGHGGANMFSADLLGFVLPGFHRWWGGLFSSYNLGRDSVVYLGLIASALAVYGGWKHRNDLTVRCIAVVGLCFWIMSLGPYLHVNGIWVFAGFKIPLPYLAMTDIPLIGENRTPCRFHLMTVLAVALLAGYGLRDIFARGGGLSRQLRLLLPCAVALLVVIEYMPPHQTPGDTSVPPVYLEMARDSRVYSVLQLPLSRWSAIYKNGSSSPALMMYYQTIHEKQIFSGLASRLPPEDLDFRDRILNLLVESSIYDMASSGSKSQPDINYTNNLAQLGRMLSLQREQFLRKYGIHYVVLHEPLTGRSASKAFLESFMGREFTADVENGVLYMKVN